MALVRWSQKNSINTNSLVGSSMPVTSGGVDYKAIIGTHIPPLGPSKQIPAEFLPNSASIYYPVQTEADMIALTEANIGDYAYIISTNLLYFLLRDPASDINNWRLITQPYAVTAFNGRPGPSIIPQAGDYTTDLVPEGEDPLRVYFTPDRFAGAFSDALAQIVNQQDGVVGLDEEKIASATDFTLSNTSRTLRNLYDSIDQRGGILGLNAAGEATAAQDYRIFGTVMSLRSIYNGQNLPMGFVTTGSDGKISNSILPMGEPYGVTPLNNVGKIDSQYLPAMPTSYTDDNARAALAAANYDKLLGIKNTAVASANMLDNTLNIYVDSSRNEYLQHKIAGTVNNRRIAMHGTAVTFSSVAIAGDITPTTTNVSNLGSASYQLNNIYSRYSSVSCANRVSRFQVNNFIPSAYIDFYNDSPALIASSLTNFDGTNLRPLQDTLTLVSGGEAGLTTSSLARFKIGGYAKDGTTVRSSLSICVSHEASSSERNNTPEILKLISGGAVALAAKTTAPPDESLFNNSMAFYTDPSQKYYAAKIKKNDSSTAILSALPISTADAPPAKDGPAAALKFYTMSNYLYVQINSVDGSAPAKFCPIGVLQDAV